MQPTNPNKNKHDLDPGMITRNCYDGDSEAMRFILAKGFATSFKLSHKEDDSINAHSPQSETFKANQEINSIGFNKVIVMITGHTHDNIRLQASPFNEGDKWVDVQYISSNYEIIDCVAKRVKVVSDKETEIHVILSC